ncbi:MAG TPA: type II restriction endonuclease [Chitinophagales bacterium]|nr:type II restriction endonuclease [Chitinophagales bacterium]
MTKSEKVKHKSDFKTALKKFTESLKDYVSTDTGDWTIKGFIDVYKNIYTISSDTKIVSKILEIHIFPQIMKFAESIGYSIVLAEKQNWYPDLSFVKKDNQAIKFAVDLKTTYRDPDFPGYVNGFTLGSHGTYFKDRTSTKNIQFAYSHYLGHFCLGVIYTRIDFGDINETEIYQVEELKEEHENVSKKVGQREVTTVKRLKSITSVIKDFDFFVAEKWEIASDHQGSANTANIGSITNIADLKNANGIFAKLGEHWFDEYWMNYGIAMKMGKGEPQKITRLKDFLEFRGKKNLLRKIVNRQTKKKSEK